MINKINKIKMVSFKYVKKMCFLLKLISFIYIIKLENWCDKLKKIVVC